MDIRKTKLFTTPIAHRGLHNETAPENSMAAFRRAIEHGYAIELDIRPIDDGTIVVFHDSKLSRMTDRDGYVSMLSKKDIEEIRLGGTDEKIPTFREVLDLVDGQVPLLIEIKNSDKVGALEGSALAMLQEYKGEFAVQSFNPYTIEYFKKNAPHFLRGQLSCVFKKSSGFGFFKRNALSKLKLNRIACPDFISYKIADLPNKHVTKTKLPVLGWTVRSNADLEHARLYCDNVIFENITPELTTETE